jgi:hypothetical protein
VPVLQCCYYSCNVCNSQQLRHHKYWKQECLLCGFQGCDNHGRYGIVGDFSRCAAAGRIGQTRHAMLNESAEPTAKD